MSFKSLRLAAFTFAAALVLCTSTAAEDELGGLPRRGSLGTALAPPVDGEPGIEIQQVMPNSAASRAGIEIGDVLLSINGTAVSAPREVIQIVAKSAGRTLPVRLLRGGGEMDIEVKIDPLPLETAADFKVVYDAVEVGDFKVRCIYTIPSGEGPFPTFFMIQGVACGSIDVPGNQIHPSKEIAHRLAAKGYATMRVEKSSMGDSAGPPCDELDFVLEAEIFRRGLEKCMGESFVDRDRVFLFGHSMGGIIAPILATETQVAGVCAYGTYSYPWLEYLAKNSRRQYGILGGDPIQREGQMRATWKFHNLLMGEDWTPTQIREKHPELASFLEPPFGSETGLFGRHYKFWQQMEDTPVLQQWRDCKTRVLAIWGESDFVTSREEHELIADAVNSYAPGTAEFKALANADHGIMTFATQREAFLEPDPNAPFNDEFINVVVAWMKDAGGESAVASTAK